MTEFQLPIRVYYEDTDAAGLVYHSNYLNFMERCRTEWLRDLGFEQTDLKNEYDRIFVVRHTGVDYVKPALFNDLLSVTSQVTKIGRASLDLQQRIYREDTLLCRGEIKLACIAASTLLPSAFPPSLAEALSTSYE